MSSTYQYFEDDDAYKKQHYDDDDNTKWNVCKTLLAKLREKEDGPFVTDIISTQSLLVKLNLSKNEQSACKMRSVKKKAKTWTADLCENKILKNEEEMLSYVYELACADNVQYKKLKDFLESMEAKGEIIIERPSINPTQLQEYLRGRLQGEALPATNQSMRILSTLSLGRLQEIQLGNNKPTARYITDWYDINAKYALYLPLDARIALDLLSYEELRHCLHVCQQRLGDLRVEERHLVEWLEKKMETKPEKAQTLIAACTIMKNMLRWCVHLLFLEDRDNHFAIEGLLFGEEGLSRYHGGKVPPRPRFVWIPPNCQFLLRPGVIRYALKEKNDLLFATNQMPYLVADWKASRRVVSLQLLY